MTKTIAILIIFAVWTLLRIHEYGIIYYDDSQFYDYDNIFAKLFGIIYSLVMCASIPAILCSVLYVIFF